VGANPAVGDQLVFFGHYQNPLFPFIRKSDAGSALQILGIADLFHLSSLLIHYFLVNDSANFNIGNKGLIVKITDDG
jgi:sorbitol-specific phosphotransferase system component IIC